MILSGAVLVLAIALNSVLSVPAFAGNADIEAGPVKEHPQVYLIKKVLDICDQFGGTISGSDPLEGGSVPPSDQQQGCVDLIGDRFSEYLFTGEQLGVLVAVRHTNGADAIAEPVVLEVDGEVKVLCNDITSDEPALANPEGVTDHKDWYGHDVSQDLKDQPPAKSAGTSDGFDPDFDKLFQCIYTATEDDVGSLPVEVVATDVNGEEGRGALDLIYFNPEILVDVITSDGGPITFADGSSGQTVYSTNHLLVTNESPGGVVLFVWIAATDLVSSEGPAKCPFSNILDVEKALEYRCKIGSLFNNPWNYVQNPNDKEDCTIFEEDHEPGECQGATLLLPDFPLFSFLTGGAWAECWFRLTYPTPCIGLFDQGQILIYARAI